VKVILFILEIIKRKLNEVEFKDLDDENKFLVIFFQKTSLTGDVMTGTITSIRQIIYIR
jgi:hypothetical protein